MSAYEYRQLPNEAAATKVDVNELALLESFDLGEWASAPSEAQDIAPYRAAAKHFITRTLPRIEAQA